MSFLKSIVTGDDTLRIEPPRATLGELQLTNKLQMVKVDPQVSHVAARLKSIDTGLVLTHDRNVKTAAGQGVFVLHHEGFNERGEWVEDFVGAYTELDDRIVNLIERLDAQGRGRYELQRELDRLESAADRENERVQREQFGEAADRLRHALRADLGLGGSSVRLGDRIGRRAGRNRGRRK